jgi:hypothetical protein
MTKIYLITDYLGRFGTKFTGVPYRSGMNKELLKNRFFTYGIEAIFVKASEVSDFTGPIKDQVFLYTSSEDRGGYYKSYIEDVVLSLECRNAVIIPAFRFLRAHNNKVLVELLRKEWGKVTGDNLKSNCYGCFEEIKQSDVLMTFPVVIKKPEGYKSREVYLARSRQEYLHKASKLSRSINYKSLLKDRLRELLHKGFIRESQHRKKLVIQEFVPGLKNDWKVLVFGEKYYPLLRKTRKNDFRASGSGLLSFPEELPDGLLDAIESAVKYFNVPQLSADIGFDGSRFYFFELQFVYFGTYTIEYSPYYFIRENGKWSRKEGRSVLEEEYAASIASYLRRNDQLQ